MNFVNTWTPIAPSANMLSGIMKSIMAAGENTLFADVTGMRTWMRTSVRNMRRARMAEPKHNIYERLEKLPSVKPQADCNTCDKAVRDRVGVIGCAKFDSKPTVAIPSAEPQDCHIYYHTGYQQALTDVRQEICRHWHEEPCVVEHGCLDEIITIIDKCGGKQHG